MKKKLKQEPRIRVLLLKPKWIMSTFFSLVFFSFLQAMPLELQNNISLSLKNASLESVIWELKEQTGFTFLYSTDDIKDVQHLNVDVKKANINTVLKECLEGQDLEFDVSHNTVVIMKAEKHDVVNFEEDIEEIEIQGKVTDSEGTPLPGATVLEVGTVNGVTTDINGKYTLKVKNSKSIIKFSYIGYETQEITVGTKQLINVVLKSEASSLDEVVVIGYGSTKIKDATGSVSFISAKEISEAPLQTSVQSVLQGRAVGVNVMVQSSAPDSPISVIIRGTSSLSGDSQPLWVIDGVPEYSAGTSGDISNTLYNLNLDDIESINILKDASSAAIYGSRAANGVVLVTTRQGKKNAKPQIEVSAKYSFKQIKNDKYKLLTGEQYIDFVTRSLKQTIVNSHWAWGTKDFIDYNAFLDLRTSQFNEDMLTVLPDAFGTANTDWYSEITQPAHDEKYNLSIKGGGNNSRYYVALNFGLNKGVVKNSDAKTFGARIRYTANISKKLEYNINLSLNGRMTNSKNSLLNAAAEFRPDLPPYNPDGTLFDAGSYFRQNPLVGILNKDEGLSKSGNLSTYLLYEIIPGLKFKTSGSVRFSNSRTEILQRPGSLRTSHEGRKSISVNDNYTFMWENLLTYNKEIKDHTFDFLSGFSIEKSSSESVTANGEKFPDYETMTNLSYASILAKNSEYYNATSLVSWFGRLNYKFSDKYLATFTIRADGSSKFGPENRWGYFPSGAVGWLISEEDFMKPIKDKISYMKLRVSLGKSGSQNLSAYEWRKLMDATTSFDLPAIIPGSQIGNPFLQWEETSQLDIGLDFGLLKDRIRGTLGYYKKSISNMIYRKALAPSTAYSYSNYNIAGITNKGLEFDITWDVIRKKDLLFKLGFNIARNVGKVDKIDGVIQELNLPAGWGTTSQSIKLKPGQPLGDWYGFQTAGRYFATMEEIIALRGRSSSGYPNKYFHTYDVPGGRYIIDQNGDDKIDADDRVPLNADYNPDFFGGFNINCMWKGFNVVANFTYSYGNKRYWYALYDMINSSAGYNTYAIVLDGYLYTQDPRADFPGFPKNYNYQFNEDFLYDASYIRLNNLTLNYNIPRRLLKNTLISKIVVNFQVTNLFTITKYPGMDPQGNWDANWDGAFFGMGIDRGIYPPAKTYTFGLKITLN